MLRALRNAVPSADVLVVDDGSPDGTAKKAIELAEELGSVAVLQRSEKSGLGGAYRAGFRLGPRARLRPFVEIDCDFSHDPAALPTCLTRLGTTTS